MTPALCRVWIERAAVTDGQVDEILDRPWDPRGAFIRRPEFHELDYPIYRDAYDKAYRRSVKTRPR